MIRAPSNTMLLIGWFVVLTSAVLCFPPPSSACQKATPGPNFDLSHTESGQTKLLVWSIRRNLNFKLTDESDSEHSISITSTRLPTTMLRPMATETESGDVTLYIITPDRTLSEGTYTLRLFPQSTTVRSDSYKNERKFYVRGKSTAFGAPPDRAVNITTIRAFVYVSFDALCEPIYEPRTYVNVSIPSGTRFYKVIWAPDGNKPNKTGWAHGNTFSIPKRWFGETGETGAKRGTLKILPINRSGTKEEAVTRRVNVNQIDVDQLYLTKKNLIRHSVKWLLVFFGLLFVSGVSFFIYKNSASVKSFIGSIMSD